LSEEQGPTGAAAWQKWAFAAIPALGLLELGAHVVQTHSVARRGDWEAARAYVETHATPDDLVDFAPRWVDPIGREVFGKSIATLQREARPDETRFPRALEVSIRGAHLPELASWRRGEEHTFGRVAVTTWGNPSPAHVVDDLVSMVDPERLHVTRVDGGREADCPAAHSPVQSGALGFGPAVPADRFTCPNGGFVAVSVVADLEYRPHRCIYAPAPGGGGLVRLRFANVQAGRTLYGHHAIYVEAERDRRGPPVTLTFKSGTTLIGSVVHHDGDGWKAFEFDTSELAGQRVDIVAEISAPSGERRQYCFEADTR
jgi:hypothetical protein